VHWRLASSKEEIGEGKHDNETQAASVASVSGASGSFEDFTARGGAADAKSSKLTKGASVLVQREMESGRSLLVSI